MTEAKRRSLIRFQHWCRGPLGRLFLETETMTVARILSKLFGYHILALGVSPGNDLLQASPISHHYHLDSMRPLSGGELDILAEPDCLPIASDCIDVVVLSHGLEFTDNPSTVLKEVERILIPEGHVIILGFNPFSLWGLWRFPGVGKEQATEARFVSVAKVRNWLTSLGFEIISVEYSFYRPPLQRAVFLEKLAFLERIGATWWPFWGGSYVLVARKRVSTLTPIKPRWQSRHRLLTEGVANRTSRNYRRG